MPCQQCRAVYAARSKKDRWNPNPVVVAPPCERCHPGAHPLNEPVLRIFELVNDQWRVDAAGNMNVANVDIVAALQVLRAHPAERPELMLRTKELLHAVRETLKTDRSTGSDNGPRAAR